MWRMRQSKAGIVLLFYQLRAVQAPSSMFIHFLCLIFLMSINGPRWLHWLQPSGLHCSLQKGGRAGARVHVNWPLRKLPWRCSTSFLFRSHQLEHRHMAPYNGKGIWELTPSPLFFPGKPWTEIKKKNQKMKTKQKKTHTKSRILLQWKRGEFIGSQPAVSASLSSNLWMNQRDMVGASLKSNLNEANGGSFIFCPHCCPDGQFLGLWGKTFLLLSLNLLWNPFMLFKMLKLWIKCKCSLWILMD